MNIFNRAVLFLKRNKVKSFVLYLICFITGILLFTTTTIVSGIDKIVSENLKASPPSISLSSADMEDSESLDFQSLENEEIKSIENSEFWVKTISHMQLNYDINPDQKISPYTPDIINYEEVDNLQNDNDKSQGIFRDNSLYVNATSSTDILKNKDGFNVNLDFTAEELESKKNVIILNDEFMKENKLAIGDSISMNVSLYSEESKKQDNITSENWIEFIIIGDYSYIPSEKSIKESEQIALNENGVNPNKYITPGFNTALIPITTAQDQIDASREKILYENNLDLKDVTLSSTLYHDYSNLFIAPEYTFYYDNIKNFDTFKSEIEEKLSEENQMVIHNDSLDSGIEYGILNKIVNLSSIILCNIIGWSILFLSMIIVLFIRDRKKEIGILIALGEKKHKVYCQFIYELGILITCAFTIAIPIGYVLANILSNYSNGDVDIFNLIYNIPFTLEALLVYYLIGFCIVILATLSPLLYMLKLRPKKILL